MENRTIKILSCVTVDRREIDFKSPNMEAKGFKASLADLKRHGLNVSEVVTDAHMAVEAIISISVLFNIKLQHTRNFSPGVTLYSNDTLKPKRKKIAFCVYF